MAGRWHRDRHRPGQGAEGLTLPSGFVHAKFNDLNRASEAIGNAAIPVKPRAKAA